jgi:hypothetical protein
MPQFLQSVTAPAWSALISTGALIATITFFVFAWRRDHFSRGIDAIRWMDARFQSPEFRELRQRAASHLIEKPEMDSPGREALYEVLNFFETLAFLCTKDVTEAYSVWHFFGSWLMPYYSASKDIIVLRRKDCPSLWSDMEGLYKAVCEIETGHHPSKDTHHVISETAINEFLKRETVLPTMPRPSTAPLYVVEPPCVMSWQKGGLTRAPTRTQKQTHCAWCFCAGYSHFVTPIRL